MKQICIEKATNQRRRYTYYEDCKVYFVYQKNRSRYGISYSEKEFLKNFTLITLTEDEITKKWKNKLRKIAKYLKASGLWKNLLITLEEILKIESKKEYDFLCDSYWSLEDDLTEEDLLKLEEMNQKYPYFFDSKKIVNICSEFKNPIVKAMNFGKGYSTENERKIILEHIQNQTKYSTYARVNYDVSFSYEPAPKDNIPKAWYSEEYRNCGNGHYYLALDHMHALFCEND